MLWSLRCYLASHVQPWRAALCPAPPCNDAAHVARASSNVQPNKLWFPCGCTAARVHCHECTYKQGGFGRQLGLPVFTRGITAQNCPPLFSTGEQALPVMAANPKAPLLIDFVLGMHPADDALAICMCAVFFIDICQGIHAQSVKSSSSVPARTRQAITAYLPEQLALLQRLTPASKHAGQLRLIVLTLSSPLNTATTQERACRLDHRSRQQITFIHPRPALHP